MSENTEQQLQLSDEEKQELMRSLLEKKGSWVEWGKMCQKLQKARVNPKEIFEETGFQNSQQNLVIVASQVYESLVKSNAEDTILEYSRGPHSDVLYEFRILSQQERLNAVTFAKEKNLDVDGAKLLAKAIKEFYNISQTPSGFTLHPGDALAYQYWKTARQKKTLSERANLIAQGLKFAHSTQARQEIEKLLTDLTVTNPIKEPLLPLYRLEEEDALPCILPLVGTFPLKKEDLDAVPYLEIEEPFRMVEVKNAMKLVPLPGWQAILKAQDAVVILCQKDDLPKDMGGKSEVVLIVVDRGIKEWNKDSYFLIEKDENLDFQWFPESPKTEILGQIILILRPRKILDENNLLEPWQMDD